MSFATSLLYHIQDDATTPLSAGGEIRESAPCRETPRTGRSEGWRAEAKKERRQENVRIAAKRTRKDLRQSISPRLHCAFQFCTTTRPKPRAGDKELPRRRRSKAKTNAFPPTRIVCFQPPNTPPSCGLEFTSANICADWPFLPPNASKLQLIDPRRRFAEKTSPHEVQKHAHVRPPHMRMSGPVTCAC